MICSKEVYKKLNIIIFICLIVSFALNFYFSDRASTGGSGLLMYESIEDSLGKENESLQNTYFSLTSLSTIYEMAIKNGLVEASVEFYTAPDFALRQ